MLYVYGCYKRPLLAKKTSTSPTIINDTLPLPANFNVGTSTASPVTRSNSNGSSSSSGDRARNPWYYSLEPTDVRSSRRVSLSRSRSRLFLLLLFWVWVWDAVAMNSGSGMVWHSNKPNAMKSSVTSLALFPIW